MEEDKVKKAFNNAYCLLRSRPRSEKEMRERLRYHGYDDEMIEEVVRKLKQAGQIDDAKFAMLWVESRMSSNPMGEFVLRQELKDKGVDDAVVDTVLAEAFKGDEEYEAAMNMAREKFDRLAGIDKRKAMKRLYDFLGRRGFKFDVIKRVVDEIVK